MPVMGIRSSNKISEAAALYASASLSDALFTLTQQRVLGCLFGQPTRSYSVSELIQLTGAGSGAVQRELARLAGSGLVSLERVGNQKRYSADPSSPVHAELVSIVRKTFGLADPLRKALKPFAGAIDCAFVYGSVARGDDKAGSDIDLLLVSETLSYSELMLALEAVTNDLGRPINPTLYSREELTQRIQTGNNFIDAVLAQPKLWLIGGKHDLPAR